MTGEGSVTLGNGVTYTGRVTRPPRWPRPTDSVDQRRTCHRDRDRRTALFHEIRQWWHPGARPDEGIRKIVVCDRGTNARVNKSQAVQEAGGIGMILVNTAPNSLNADFHFVPTVHLSEIDGAAVKAYVTSGKPVRGRQFTREPARRRRSTRPRSSTTCPRRSTAAFSSRGPLAAGAGDLLKPDLIAPGQDILAAVAPPGNAGRSFNVYSGTSMSAPHVAGLAALLMHLKNEDGNDDHHRGDWDDENDDDGWSPMMIKSALMTTASDVLDAGGNTSPAVIFSQGAGHVTPNDAAHPGLVFDSDEDDWLAFMCGASPVAVEPGVCGMLSRRGFSFDASDMNVASIAIGDIAGSQTVTRTVTNVGGSRATYTASVTGMTGINVPVSPASFTVRPGRSKTFTVTFTRTTAPTTRTRVDS